MQFHSASRHFLHHRSKCSVTLTDFHKHFNVFTATKLFVLFLGNLSVMYPGYSGGSYSKDRGQPTMYVCGFQV